MCSREAQDLKTHKRNAELSRPTFTNWVANCADPDQTACMCRLVLIDTIWIRPFKVALGLKLMSFIMLE